MTSNYNLTDRKKLDLYLIDKLIVFSLYKECNPQLVDDHISLYNSNYKVSPKEFIQEFNLFRNTGGLEGLMGNKE